MHVQYSYPIKNILLKPIRYYFYLACLLLVFIAGCSRLNSGKIPAPKIITVDSKSVVPTFDIDSMISDFRLVPLKTSADCIISAVKKVFTVNGSIVVQDEKINDSIFIFDSAGNIKKTIKLSDKSSISDVFINHGNIYLYCGPKKRVDMFDTNGLFLKSFQLNSNLLATGCAALGNNTFVFWNSHAPCRLGNFQVLILNNNGTFVDGFQSFSFEESQSIYPQNDYPFIHAGDSTLLVCEPLKDTIFQMELISESEFVFYPKYVFKFSDKSIPNAFLKDNSIPNKYVSAFGNNYSFLFNRVLNIDSFFYCTYFSNHQLMGMLINKRNDSIICNTANILSNTLGLSIPLNSFQLDNKTIASVYNSYDLLTWYKYNKSSNPLGQRGQLESICSHLTELDNPILLLMKTK